MEIYLRLLVRYLRFDEMQMRRLLQDAGINVALRIAFYVLRWFGDKTHVADWTRGWGCLWRVNASPVGGPILRLKHVLKDCPWPIEDHIATWCNRQDAIDAEIEFLNDWFTERGI